MGREPPCPAAAATLKLSYPIGQRLSLEIDRSREWVAHHAPVTLTAEVAQLSTSNTFSTGLIVRVAGGTLPISPPSAFLKLFDRRFATQLRAECGIDPWTPDVDNACLTFVTDGRASVFWHKLRTDARFQEDEEEHWDEAENEAFLADRLLGLFQAEMTAYGAVREHQGKLFPRVLAPVSVDIAPASTAIVDDGGEMKHKDASQDMFRAKGILLEHLDGFTLETLEQQREVPRSSWQNIVDQAIAIVHLLGDHNVLNGDVRPENFMVLPRDSADDDDEGPRRHRQPRRDRDTSYQVLMIDLAQCRLRRADESDGEWGRAKWQQDEEGAVGFVMKHRLHKVGFDLHFQHSHRYLKWAEREDE